MKLTKDTLIEGHVYKEGVEYSVKPIQESSSMGTSGIDKVMKTYMKQAQDECLLEFEDQYLDDGYQDEINSGKHTIEYVRTSILSGESDFWISKLAENLWDELLRVVNRDVSEAFDESIAKDLDSRDIRIAFDDFTKEVINDFF